jgi:anti-sigma factor RsiW
MSDIHVPPEQLNAHLLGELGDREAQVVAAHLESCCSCREAEARLREAVAAFAAVRPVPPRDLVLAALLADQRALGTRSRHRRAAGGRAIGAIAAALAIFLCGFWAGRRDSSILRADEAGFRPGGPRAASERKADLQPPRVTFAVAVPDRVAGQAVRDTTVN